ncbi:MAG: serine/threonine-protein kinase [Polyangiaceae bacterium]
MTGPDPEASSNEASADSLVGQVVSDRYRLDAVLGEGGMGLVFRGEHLLMRKRVAVKVLHAELTRMPEIVARFEREAMAAAHIEHPNVAAATDFGKLANGSFFLVLEYVDGKNLRDQIHEVAPFPPERAVHITRQILSALYRAHSIGIVHRDLKPENIMLVERDGDTDFVKVLDFGIAKVPVGELANQGGKTQALTQLGMVYGTPEYMAPEQALGQDVDLRADLYALGVMLYEMLTGKRPFDADNKVQILGMVVSMPVPAMASMSSGLQVPPALEEFTRTLLSKLAKDRFSDARAALEALDAAFPVEHVPGHPMSAKAIMAARAASMPSLGDIPRPRASGSLVSADEVPTHVIPPAASSGAVVGSAGLSGAYGALANPGSAGLTSAETIPTLLRPIEIKGAEKIPPMLRTPAALGGAALAFVLLLVGVGIAASSGDSSGANAAGSASASASAVASAAPAVLSDEKLDAAIASGLSALDELYKEFPEDPRLLRAMVHAQAAEKKPAAMVTTLPALAKVDAASLATDKVRDDVIAAVQLDGGADALFPVIESQIGGAGPDILQAIVNKIKAPSKLNKRALESLKKPEVRALMGPAQKVAFDLAATYSMAPAAACDERKKLFKVAKEVGDSRSLQWLTPLVDTKGCGGSGWFSKKKDCFPCLRGDNSLQDAISSIRARAKEESSP